MFFFKMLETPLKCCSQKLTFLGALGTGAKAPVPKKSLKVFQNRFLMKFCNILKYLIGKLKNLHSNGCIVEMLRRPGQNLQVLSSIPSGLTHCFLPGSPSDELKTRST